MWPCFIIFYIFTLRKFYIIYKYYNFSNLRSYVYFVRCSIYIIIFFFLSKMNINKKLNTTYNIYCIFIKKIFILHILLWMNFFMHRNMILKYILDAYSNIICLCYFLLILNKTCAKIVAITYMMNEMIHCFKLNSKSLSLL